MILGVRKLKNQIEVPTFLAVFSIFVQNSVFTNLVIYRTCYLNLGYNKSECKLLGAGSLDNDTTKLDELVEPVASSIILYLQLPAGLMCAVLTLLAGSWSDRNGRKPILLSAIAGQGMSFAMISIFCLIPGLSAWYLYFAVIPMVVTGGFPALMSTIMSYITDISDEHSRGTRLGLLEVVFSLGSLLGTFSSSYIFKEVGYVGIYMISSGCLIAALCFTLFVMEESLPERQLELQTQPSYVKLMRDMLKSTFEKRPYYQRSLILLCILILSLFIFATISDTGILYLFLQLKFGWSLHKYTIFSSLRDLVIIAGTFIGVYVLHKKWKVDETIVAILGLISSMGSSTVLGLASIDSDIFFAAGLKLLGGCVNPMVRSVLSKLAKPGEVGKFFSVTIMCQSILQLVGAPIYTGIYNSTLETCPSLYNFLTAAIYFLALVLTIVVIFLRSKGPSGITFNVLEKDIVAAPASINDDDEVIQDIKA